MKDKIQKTKKGYALVELIFYIALLIVLTLAIINSLVTMTKAFRETAVQTDLVQSSLILERISREIRQSYGINSISASDLKLNTTDELNNNKAVRFLLSSSNIQLFENDVFTGNLNTTNIEVTALNFTEITTTTSKAIKVSLSVKSTKDGAGRIENFYGTVVLRESY